MYTKRIAIILLLITNFYVFSDNLSDKTKSIILNSKKYYNHDKTVFVVPLPSDYSDTKSCIYIESSDFQQLLQIPFLGKGQISWSENGAFFLINNGTGPERSLIVFNYITLEVIGKISVHGNQFKWVDDNILLTSSQSGYRIEDMVLKYSIYINKISNNSINSEEIYMANELIDFKINTEDNSNEIIISKIIYENTNSPSPWTRYKEIDKNDFIFQSE